VLYTRYIFFFQAAGLVLLVAMIGAIVLDAQHKPNVKRQNISPTRWRATSDRHRGGPRSGRGRALAHVPEKWKPVFRKEHAPTTSFGEL